MEKLLCFCLVVCVLVNSAASATRFYKSDFSSGATGASGWTADGDAFRRTFPNEALSVEVFSNGGDVSVKVGADADTAVEVGGLSAPVTNALFRIPSAAGVRFVSLSSAGLLGCAVETVDTRIPSPANLRIYDVSDDSLSVSWNAVDGAEGYRVEVFTNALVGASEGRELWRETFAGVATNSTASTKGFSMETFRSLVDTVGADWNGSLVFPYDHADGAVRVGNTSNAGWLSTPPVNAEAEEATLHFRAWRFDSDPSMTNRAAKPAFYGVDHVFGATTNSMGVVRLTTAPSNVVLSVPDWRAGGRFVFHSATNKYAYRFAVDGMSLRTGYNAGVPTSVVCSSKSVAAGTTAAVFEGLPKAEVRVSVTALAASSSDDSPAADVSVDLAHPPASVALRAFPLDGAAYSEAFDCLTNVTKKIDWRNCATVPYWQAFLDRGEGDVEPVAGINQNAGGITANGLYAWHDTEDSVVSRSLGTLATEDVGLVLGVAFRNAMETALTGLSAAFTAEQWNFRKGTKTIPFEWLVTNELVSVVAEGDWRAVDAAAFTTVAAPSADNAVPRAERKTAAISADIPPGGYLLIRWTDAAKASSCPFAVDDVELRYTAKARATLITVR